MSSQPPGGPPSGPLSFPPPPGAAPGPPDAGKPGPRWRSRRFLALAVAGVAVVTGLVVTLVLTLGGGPSRSPAEARELVTNVAATATDWGPGFDDLGDRYDTGELLAQKDCELTARGNRPGTLVGLQRVAKSDEGTLFAMSDARAFKNAATAEAYMKDIEDTLHRCPVQRTPKARYEDVREGAAPHVSGLDHVISEEGRATLEDGQNTNYSYVALTGRKGEVVLYAAVEGPPESKAELPRLAAEALERMNERLSDAAALRHVP